MKRVGLVFILAFITNIIWENLHSFLYSDYMGNKITESILLRASFWDAVIIALVLLPFLFLRFFRKMSWLIIPIGIVIALKIEWFALATGRWTYNEYMPIIPILNAGLTPIIQLGLLGFLIYNIVIRNFDLDGNYSKYLETNYNKKFRFLAGSIFLLFLFFAVSEVMTKKVDKVVEDKEIQQFVLLSFDGGKSIETWRKTLDFADSMNTENLPVHFTYFINSVYLLASENSSKYTSPSGEVGHSAIGFADDLNSIADRIHEINRAIDSGHEIGSHAAGHWPGGNMNENWSVEKWLQEFSSFNNLLFSFKENNLYSSSSIQIAESLRLKQEDIKGFRAPYLSINDNMYEALSIDGFTYDSSEVSYENENKWPIKDKNGIWHIQIPSVYFPQMKKSIIAVDYSIWLNQSGGENNNFAKGTKEWQEALGDLVNGYMGYFEKSYSSNRAPMIIVNHFPLWNDGLYWEAMKEFAKKVCARSHVQCSTFSTLVNYLENRNKV